MSEALSNPSALQAKLAIGVFLTFVSALCMIWILLRIEQANNLMIEIPEQDEPDAIASSELELEEEDETGKVPKKDSPKEKTKRKKLRRLSWVQRAWVIATVATLILINYLLLVFLPSSLVLSLVGVIAIWIVLLRSPISDEIRRQRLDRLLAILTLFLFTAASMSLATYARQALQQGSIYQGPARIIGYDDESYANKDGLTMRTDLEVAWGGSWGCPETGKQCTAVVQGALCYTKYETRRRLETQRMLKDEDQAGKDGDEAADAADEEAENEELEQDVEEEEKDNEELEEDVEEEDEENEALEDELDEEEEENEELEEDLEDEDVENEELDEENEELEEAIEDIEWEGYYDDDIVYDDYWDYDWESVWGEYACEDMFEYDLEGQTYDADTPPGSKGDEWPYLLIYGSCNTCEAYLQDYYSSEHFHQIKSYQTHGRYYLYAALVSLALTLVAALKQRLAPAHEKEIELLTNEGGVHA